jgi:serine/threonine-protein phosphatase 6 regulatory ankyrin repeat subunit B
MKYIKLFEEHNYSVYELITMSPYQAHDLLMNEILKGNPDLELIKDILAYTVVDVNGKNSNDWTALMRSAYRGYENLVELLLNHPGIDVNVQNNDGYTALIFATNRRNEKCVELLLKHPKIDVNVESKWAKTALMRAAEQGNEKCVELLLNHPGINISLKNVIGETAWNLATHVIRRKFPQLKPDAL